MVRDDGAEQPKEPDHEGIPGDDPKPSDSAFDDFSANAAEDAGLPERELAPLPEPSSDDQEKKPTAPPSVGTGLSRPIVDFSGISSALGAVAAASAGYKGMQEQFAKSLAPALASVNSQALVGLQSLTKSIAQLNAANLYPSTEAITALARQMAALPALTRLRDYQVPDPPTSPYSHEMKSPQSYFQSTEVRITCFDDLHSAISKLISKTPDLPLVWRGVRNASWGLHSHLYRQLMRSNGVEPPSSSPTEPQRYPDEDQMVAAEREILAIARTDWRFDNLSALETFARIQHAGGPTRLIDVSKNPYIGAWFAVEFDEGEEDKDARLFALATRPVAKDGKPAAPDSAIQLDDLGSARDPFWHLLSDTPSRQQFDWGTGARRRVWVPPAYDPRISAQNAAFILDGVPMTSAKTAPYFKIEGSTYWRRADLLASASIYAKMFKATAKPRYNARNFAPTFSFRIDAGAKKEIRDVMESRFGYRMSYIYPDMAALAAHLKARFS